ncbi:uncharacterized protein isoform X2 [Leptinotarsa decemlineata]|uniref:uncharacterized protein isoform X2 n=1 Tax=Leptinotarsa decemlineata TaxID=7539 RepID=UPI003D30CA7F
MVCMKQYFHGLKNVLLVLVYLTLITLPSSSSAPLSMDRKQNPRWVNPCGMPEDTTDSISKLNASEKRELLLQISKQAGIALRHAEAFKENFTRKIFKSENVDKVFEEQRYDWLPNLPDLMFLEDNSKKTEDILLDSYYYLQQVAVGLEQVIWDQQDRPGHFPSEFKAQQNYLIIVLCEIQMYINDMNIKINRDAERSIMPESLRSVESVTESNVRDYIILRTYENTLEHVKKVFSHLASKV